MTLVIAMKIIEDPELNKESVLMVSDSRATMEGLSYEEARKIMPIILSRGEDEVPIAVMSGSGNVAMVKYAYELFSEYLIEKAENEWGFETPSARDFRKAVRELERLMMRRTRELMEYYGKLLTYKLILASVSPEAKASIYVFDNMGLATPVHDDPGYAMIGIGQLSGGLLLMKLLRDFTHDNEWSLSILASFIVELVSDVNLSVSPFTGESWYMRVVNEERNRVALGPLKWEATIETKDRIMLRKNVIRQAWFVCDKLMLLEKRKDDFGEKRILELLSLISKNPTLIEELIEYIKKKTVLEDENP